MSFSELTSVSGRLSNDFGVGCAVQDIMYHCSLQNLTLVYL